MIELVSILISMVVFAFIIYSTYSTKSEEYTQRVKAFELKEAHMKKTMDMVRTEISLLEREILKTESSFEELENT